MKIFLAVKIWSHLNCRKLIWRIHSLIALSFYSFYGNYAMLRHLYYVSAYWFYGYYPLLFLFHSHTRRNVIFQKSRLCIYFAYCNLIWSHCRREYATAPSNYEESKKQTKKNTLENNISKQSHINPNESYFVNPRPLPFPVCYLVSRTSYCELGKI